MVLRLAEHLDVPLRDRNRLLLAAGYAPVYPSRRWSPRVRGSARGTPVLRAHEPYPAVVVDRRWDLVAANAALPSSPGRRRDCSGRRPTCCGSRLHPEGLAPRIANLGEWRAHLLGRLRRHLALAADPELGALHDELRGYPGGRTEPEAAPAPRRRRRRCRCDCGTRAAS